MATKPTIDDLCSLMRLIDREVRGEAVGSADIVAKFVAFGVLKPAGVVFSLLCDRCDSQHLAEIVATINGHGWYCPADGFVEAEPHDIAAYTVTCEGLSMKLQRALGGKGRCRPLPRSNPALWSLGWFDFDEHRVACYFAPNVDSMVTFNEIVALLSREQKSAGMAVLTNETSPIEQFRLPWGGRVVPLIDVSEFDCCGRLTIDTARLAAHVLPSDLLRTGRPGNPGAQRARILSVLEKLDRDGEDIVGSNAFLRQILERFSSSFPERPVPAMSTVRSAIKYWRHNQPT